MSYNHGEQAWVKTALVPCLEAGGAEILIDYRKFRAGRTLVGQMDATQDKAVVRGQNVLYELVERESTLPGEWEYILAFRTRDTQPPPADEHVHRSLRRRLLIAEEGGQWRLRDPLMQRWLRTRC